MATPLNDTDDCYLMGTPYHKVNSA